MQYTSKYKSPLGDIVIVADEIGLTGEINKKIELLKLEKAYKEEFFITN